MTSYRKHHTSALLLRHNVLASIWVESWCEVHMCRNVGLLVQLGTAVQATPSQIIADTTQGGKKSKIMNSRLCYFIEMLILNSRLKYNRHLTYNIQHMCLTYVWSFGITFSHWIRIAGLKILKCGSLIDVAITCCQRWTTFLHMSTSFYVGSGL